MAWINLLLAGLFEIAFAISIKLMNGHKNITWTIIFYVSTISSFYFLERAARTIPINIAYAIWTGIGAVGVVIIGMVFMNESVTITKIFFLVMLIVSLIGLKLSA